MKSAIAIAALMTSILLPSAAAAETVVPPGNSAATQYTEAIPTAGGNAVSGSGINGGHRGNSPSKVLGHHNAQELESKGKVGKEVANLAAETAPQQRGAGAAATTATGGSQAAGGSAGGTSVGSGGGSKPAPSGHGNGGAEMPAQRSGEPASSGGGSSGLGQVVGQATGSSSGDLGLWLPLIILATVAWAGAYAWRRRRGVAH